MSEQAQNSPALSFEFFPPKTEEGTANLRAAAAALAELGPQFFSVTFGAGGSTREKTAETVIDIQQATGIEVAPHISCVSSTRDNIREMLQAYVGHDIRRLVVLRGDLPSGMGEIGEFRYANELVGFIREQTGDHFHIEVAAYPEFHPEAGSASKDLQNFRRKVEAGANSAITQYFFNADAYFRFVDDCESMGLDISIVPGIMPITNYRQLARFSDACGAEIPRWIRRRLEGFGDDLPSLRAFGVEVVGDLCTQLLEGGAPGLHFYTLNRAEASVSIYKNLDL